MTNWNVFPRLAAATFELVSTMSTATAVLI